MQSIPWTKVKSFKLDPYPLDKHIGHFFHFFFFRSKKVKTACEFLDPRHLETRSVVGVQMVILNTDCASQPWKNYYLKISRNFTVCKSVIRKSLNVLFCVLSFEKGKLQNMRVLIILCPLNLKSEKIKSNRYSKYVWRHGIWKVTFNAPVHSYIM